MYAITCSGCGERRLVFGSQITGLTNDESGVHVRFECFCGTEGVVHTGRTRTRQVATAA